jgi:hypothetical protein
MKKSLGEIMIDPRIWEMPEEVMQQERARLLAEAAKRQLESGMLTYKDAEPIMVHAPRVKMMPSPRRGIVGWVKDRIFGVQKKPQAVMVLDKEQQERLKRHMENFRQQMDEVSACGVTAEDIKEATDRVITLARGYHIRNADGTVTDVSDNPKYKCKK